MFYLPVTRNVIRLSYRFTNCKIGVFEGKWPKSYCLTAAKNFCVSRLYSYTRIFHHNPASLLAKHFGYHWMKHSAAYSWSGGGALIVIEFKIYFHLQSAVVDNFSVFKLYFHRLRPLYTLSVTQFLRPPRTVPRHSEKAAEAERNESLLSYVNASCTVSAASYTL